MTHLTPYEVLTAITHAQERLGYIFTEEDFKEGKVGSMMVAADFDFEEAVSLLFTNSGLFNISFSMYTNSSLYFTN